MRQRLEGEFGMSVHMRLALDDGDHAAIPADDESPSFVGKKSDCSTHPKRLRDNAVRIRKERKVERVRLYELVLLVDRIAADPDALRTETLEFGSEVSEVSTFSRAPRCHRHRVE